MNDRTNPYAAFAAELAPAAEQPLRAYRALHALANEIVGARLFTILALDYDAGVMRRLYSDHKDLYPVPAADAIGDTVWEQTIIGKREALVLNSAEALKAVLPEYPSLEALGHKSMLNLPIVVWGTSIGTLNMLNVEGHFTPERVAKAYELTTAAALCLLLARSH